MESRKLKSVISDAHDVHYDEYRFLGCDTVWLGRDLPRYSRNILATYSDYNSKFLRNVKFLPDYTA
jgi:hypothetical protein